MTSLMPIIVIGAGAVGRMHIERALRHPDVMVVGVADPAPGAREYAQSLNLPWAADAADLIGALKPKAAIVATPNSSHAEIAIACLQAGLATLVEKPITDSLEDGLKLLRAAKATGSGLLVGHHRRHNPIAQTARRLVGDGVLGRPVLAHVQATWLKPDSYFNAPWRRAKGAGPVLINLIHDIDLLRFLLGDVASVQATTSHAIRGLEVEDTAAVLLRFTNGALATLAVSDAAVAPWNWDLAAGEAAHYPRQDIDSHHLSGTEGSLTLPRLQVWQYRGARGWHEPLTVSRTAPHQADPYVAQLSQLRAVAEGREAPLCSGLDGLRTLQATLAVHEAAASGTVVTLAQLDG